MLKIPKTLDIIKYITETTNLTIEDIFVLSEKVKIRKEETEYNLWLIQRLLEVAKKEGIDRKNFKEFQDQILNYFNKTETEQDLFSENYINWMKTKITDSIFIGFEKGYNLKDIDWSESEFRLIDTNENLSISNKNLIIKCTEECYKSKEKDNYIILEGSEKKITLKYKYQYYLYKVINFYKTQFNNTGKFGIIIPCTVLSDPECKEYFWYILENIQIKGYKIFSQTNTEYAFCICEIGKSKEDFIKISLTTEEKDKILEGKQDIIYTYSHKMYFDYLKETLTEKEDVYIEELGKITGKGKGTSNALAYLNFGHRMSVTTLKSKSPTEKYLSIPITEENLDSILLYFGLIKANTGNGNFTDISIPVIGNKDCKRVSEACIPLLEFCEDNLTKAFVIRDTTGIPKKINNYLKEKLIEKGELFSENYPNESKELAKIGKKIDEKFIGKNLTMREKILILNDEDPKLKSRYDRAKKNLESWIYSKTINIV